MQGRTKRQKIAIIGSFIFILVFLSTIIYIFSVRIWCRYTAISPAETGTIKEALDAKGIDSEITDDGTTIKVPEEYVDTLLVELAAEGIPIRQYRLFFSVKMRVSA